MERLQKVLAQAGIASRRKCEEYIVAGRVTVNDEPVTTLGAKVNPEEDIVKVDGKRVRLQHKLYIMFNKPKGVITSAKDPEGRQIVGDYLKEIKERVYPIGRLDYDTEGLLLLTNDGDFAQLLTHPSHHVPRTYHATVKGVPHGDLLDKLREGIVLEDGKTLPAEVEYVDVDPERNVAIISITLYEGKNRQVRRMFEAIRYPVQKLKRISFGDLQLGGLARGKHRKLTGDEIDHLRANAAESHKIQKP